MRADLLSAHALDVATVQTPAAGSLVVEFACRACGRPIRLVAGAEGTELADRAEFLREHSRCLTAGIPNQRTDEG